MNIFVSWDFPNELGNSHHKHNCELGFPNRRIFMDWDFPIVHPNSSYNTLLIPPIIPCNMLQNYPCSTPDITFFTGKSHEHVPQRCPRCAGKIFNWSRGHFLYLPQNCHFVPVYNGKSHENVPDVLGKIFALAQGTFPIFVPK
jgi:hypothetical protein